MKAVPEAWQGPSRRRALCGVGQWGQSDFRKEGDMVGRRRLWAPWEMVVTHAPGVLESGYLFLFSICLQRVWSCRCGATVKRAWSAERYGCPALGPGWGPAASLLAALTEPLSPALWKLRGTLISVLTGGASLAGLERDCQDSWCWGWREGRCWLRCR